MTSCIWKTKVLCLAALIAAALAAAACSGGNPSDPSGSGLIEIALNDEGADLLTASSLTLSKTLSPKTITLTAAREYSGYEWYVDAASRSTDRSFTLNAASYAAGKHYLSLEAWRNGTLYSKDLTFTVNE
jgi:ABC-type glycerol-3-phosphate transport system substrate-binding protein